jgi:ABC-type Mn2+/Zn2+ transport system permease subunit
MQRAFATATIIGALCAVIGVYVVLRSMSFIGAGISHASFGGVALGFVLNINPLYSAIVFCVATAWGIGFVSQRGRVREDTSVGIFFASTMAFGVLLIGLMRGYSMDLFSYIFGNILAVSAADLKASVILALIVIGTIVYFYKEFLFLTFDPEMAAVTGLPVQALNFILLTLIALTVVISIKAVGIVLVSALIVTPAAAANQLTEDFRKMMIIAIILGIGASWAGLFLSSLLNIASGATIVMTSTAVFFISALVSPQRRRLRKTVGELQHEVVKD